VGGANSIRAFNARAIGPGKYKSEKKTWSYVEQVGDVKFQANLEYRPHLVGSLYGAVFLDVGNVWLLDNYMEQDDTSFKFGDMFKQMAVGTGIGLRYDVGFFILRLDWGIGLHVPYETGRSGFYNIRHFKDAQALHLAIGLPF
jgi:outer membrane protein assembly factor BamA